jgi:hypothetical protein
MRRVISNVKTTSTPLAVVFDFTQDLTFGESLSSAVVTTTVFSGADSNPSAVTSASPAISGSQVTQAASGGVLGVTYAIVCAVATSLGQALSLLTYVVVVPDEYA